MGWEHAYHTVALGLEASPAGHLIHVLRDTALVWPLALLATIVGLRFTRPLTRAVGTSVAMGVLLVPSAEIHDGSTRLSAARITTRRVHRGCSACWSTRPRRAPRAGRDRSACALGLHVPRRPRMASETASHRPHARSRRPGPVRRGARRSRARERDGRSGRRASNVKTIDLTDNPGNWFDTGQNIAGTRSLTIVPSGTTVRFNVAKPAAMTVHTATSLAFPTGASSMPYDQDNAFRGTEDVTLTDPGLYVFVCKLHPFMLGAAIVDDPATPELDLGKTMTLMNGVTVPTASDFALRLVRSFFIVTKPANYQVHSAAHPTTWDPVYPAVPVRAFDKDGNPVVIQNLDAFTRRSPGRPPPSTRPTGR